IASTAFSDVKRGPVDCTLASTVVDTNGVSFFQASDVGKTLAWDNGFSAKIVTFVTEMEVVLDVDASETIALSSATVWYTDRGGVTTETKRTNTYVSGECGTVAAGGVYEMTRAFLFSAETVARTYKELGWSHTSSTSADTFSLALIADGVGVAVDVGEQLKVTYTLTVTLSPVVSTAVDDPIVTGWATSTGDYIIQQGLIRQVSSSGSGTGVDLLDPGYAN